MNNKNELRNKISEIFIRWNMPTRQVAITEILSLFEEETPMKETKIRDAYKMPFSDDEIEMELLEVNRANKIMANKWYKKGRDDEN